MKHNKKAFTLIELLVVIAIIGILATISVIALSNARAKARDAKRIADTKQVSTALELFFNDNNRYPTDAEFSSGVLSSSTAVYMQNIPSAPTPYDGTCTENQNAFSYHQTEDGGSYTISMCLGNNTGSLDAGPKCLTPGGVIDVDCSPVAPATPSFTCGIDSVNYNSHIYPTVLIGSQCWFKENLRTTNYNDNVAIPNVTDNATWGGLTSGAYSWYGNDSATYNDYGMLYNFYAVDTGKLCPTGWHVPSNSELSTLITPFIGSISALMETGTTHWVHDYGTNSSGFTALPGGGRNGLGEFSFISSTCCMWSSNSSSGDAYDTCLYSSGETSSDLEGAVIGNSVRCLKD